jgi:hypothetical protein
MLLCVIFTFRWFKYKNYTRSARCFTQGAQQSEKAFKATDENSTSDEVTYDKALMKLYIDCLNNLAACHMALNDSFKAREACIKVLEINPNNPKALFRAGRYLSIMLYVQCVIINILILLIYFIIFIEHL